MNKQKIFIKFIILFIGLIFYSHLILTLFYTIWISKPILISYYICFYSLTTCYFFIIILEFPYLGHKISQLIKGLGISIYFTFFFIMILFEIILLSVNLIKYSNYWRDCPYTLNESYENFHHKRRCELYNINNNSRYKYQYICSYNTNNDLGYELKFYTFNKVVVIFKEEKKLIEKIKNNYIQCVLFNSIILNNTVVDLFNKEYLNDKKYYCGRTNQPKKNNYVEEKECNNKSKKNIFYFFYIMCFLQIIYVVCFCLYIIYFVLEFNNYEGNNQNRISNINDKSVSSTNISDKNNDNINFKRLNTRNIIYINKREITINKDIKNISQDISNKINSNEIIYNIRKGNNSY